MTIPYVGFGNNTLDKCAKIDKGDKIECPHCGELHIIKCGKNSETGEESNLLMFYKCGEESYIAGIAGKLVAFKKADDSGEI